MSLNQREVKKIIKEEILRSTPCLPGQTLTNERTEYLAEEVVKEVFFSKLGAFFSGAGGALSKLGKDSAAPFKKAYSSVKSAASAAANAVSEYSNELSRQFHEKAVKSFEQSLQSKTKEMAVAYIKMLKKQDPSRDEESLKAEAQAVVSNAITSAVGELFSTES